MVLCGRAADIKERPEEPIGEGVTSVSVEGPELKGSWKEIEAWHHVSGLEILKKTQEKLFVKMQPRFIKDLSILEM